MKMVLEHINIENLFPDRVYERGLTYYNQNRVHDLSFNRSSRSWFAHVQGSTYYYVDVQLEDIEQGTIKTYCECPAFSTYHSCKHIVAVLLAVQNEEQRQKVLAHPHFAKEFLDSVIQLDENTVQTIDEKIPMHVEYSLHLEDSDKIYLQLKTGIEHRYVVHDIRDLLSAVLYSDHYFFTKKFTYDPTEHVFLQKDLQIFKQLESIIMSGDLFTERSYYTQGNRYDKRSLLIPPIILQDLLVHLIGRDLLIETSTGQFKEISIEQDDVPITYTVSKHSEKEYDGFLLQVNEFDDAYWFEYYNMLFKNGTFYFPTHYQTAMIQKLGSYGMDQRHIPISVENKDMFFSEVLPALKKATSVKIAQDVSSEIVEFPLRARLYLETDDNAIVGKLEYHYGPHCIEPFSNYHVADKILIRDNEKEQHIMQLIEQSNFHYNGKKLYILLDEDEEIYDFLYTILPLLGEQVELFLASEIRSMIVDYEPIPTTNVNVQSNNNLLEIGFDVSGIDDSEINSLIQSVIERRRFYRLDSGALVSLEGEEYESIQRFFTDMNVQKKDIIDGKITMPVFRGAQIDDLLETRKSYDASFRSLLRHLNNPEEQNYDVPQSLGTTLRHYQKVGFQWFKALSSYHLGGILADDMGLGKTVQTIAYLLTEPSDQPHLIVVPSSVVYNWRNECERFAPNLSVAVIAGTPEERAEIIKVEQGADIWITSYGTMRQDVHLYKDLSFATLILDEAQFIKNYVTKTSQAVREIQASRRFALSGTPIENSIDELWSIFQVILPGLLPSLRDFRQLSTEKIARMTGPFILRRLKEDVLTELPEKIETVHVSELTEDEKQLYVGYLQKIQHETAEQMAAGGFQKNRMKILAGLTRLRQLCCHPSLFIENYRGSSGKLDALMETVENFIAEGKRMLIFSQFTSMHEIIIKKLERKGIDYFYLHGQTPSEERIKMSEAFNSGENSIFLISLRAGGTGLNLTGADTVILYDLWWNPAVEDQAAGRAHRFGQQKVVQVIRMLTEGTIEEKIYELQQKKRELIDQVIQPGETMLSSLSEDDVRDLLSI